jgi:hypothetical protein
MARFSELAPMNRRKPQTLEQVLTCDHIRAVFGLSPDSIHRIGSDERRDGPCAVHVCGSSENSFEFICDGGLLVGIPPNRSKS